LTSERLEERLALAVESVGSAFLVNDDVLGRQSTLHSAAAVAASEVNQIIVFEGKGPGDDQGVFAKVLNPSGAVVAASSRVNSTTDGDQHAPAVGTSADGSFVVAWAGRGIGDRNGIFFQRFSSNGTRVGAETLVNSTTGGVQTSSAIAVAEDGSFVVAWSGVGSGDVNGVFLQRYTAAGVRVGGETRVNSTTAKEQSAPSLAFDDEGNLFVAWQSRHQDGGDWGIYGQWFASNGTRTGNEVRINTTTIGSQSAPSVATDPTGGVVAAWQSFGQDGSGWGVIARRMQASGTNSAEVRLNDVVAGHQRDVAIAVAEDGQWLAAWSSTTTNGAGWETITRNFEPNGTPEAASQVVNSDSDGANLGHQRSPAVAIADEDAIIAWTGSGATDNEGVYAQRYEVELDNEPQQAPNLAAIPDDTAEVGNQIEVTVTATDANSRDDLIFTLDPDNAPDGATIQRIDNTTAVIRWTPGEADEGDAVLFRVIVTDDGNPPLSDSEDFTITVGEVPLQLDLNGSGTSGNNATADFVTGGGAVAVSGAAIVRGADDGLIVGATAQLAATPNGASETLSVNTTGTSITASYDAATRTLTLSGTATVAQYQQVLRTLRYNNTATAPSGERSITVRVTDAGADQAMAEIDVAILAPNLVAFAQALSNSGARFYGAGWDADSTAQKELFQDGGQFLPFIESTNPNRSLNQVAMDNDVEDFPTWIFSDGSRLVGVQTLQTLATRAGITIPETDQPFLVSPPNETLLVGSPLHVPLDGYDPNGGPLTYTVTSDNPNVTAQILSGNRSARINVAGWGDMVFELFEDRAERATDRMIELAEDDFYEDIIFHRVINGFVIQGGDPTGTGSGGSTLGDFDDQFHPDLQHNRRGLLSMAKSTDDTNDSQFFITEGATRTLDFNHTIFGLLVEGEANREAISNTAVTGPSNSPRPVVDVVMEGIDIFEDVENAVLMLKAANGATGSANITVTVADQDGNTFQRTFRVDLAADTTNGTPYLNDVAPVSVARNTPAQVQLSSVDVEGDQVFYAAQRVGNVPYTFTVSSTGLLEVTPPQDFVGTVEVLVGVGRVANSPDDTQRVQITFT
jgi:cyclophilin family peptidyl-prolyl cis-trans isomerase